MWYKRASSKIIYLMRGVPGSGKSTKAREIGKNGVIYSTDDFFMKNGIYNYDSQTINQAHEWNQKRTREAMQNGISPIVVDNTNIEFFHMKPYVGMAQQYGYQVELVPVNVKNTVQELAARNKHGVPAEAIAKMLEKYNPNATIRDILRSQPPENNKT